MRRLSLDTIQVDTTIKKNKIVKGSLQFPTEFRGNFINNEISPITYNEVGDAFYYDGDTYTINENTVLKNGNVIFTVNSAHLELTQLENGRDYDSASSSGTSSGSISVQKNGSTVTITFNNNEYTINDVQVSYDYIVCCMVYNNIGYVTLFPKSPVKRTEIKSWSVNTAGTITGTSIYLVNPLGEMVTIISGALKVNNTRICNVPIVDLIFSGDDNHVLYTAKSTSGYFYSNLEFCDKTFITSDCMLLATSQDGIYYGGFSSVNPTTNFSIDYYNNTPVQVSYNGKIMVNQIEYAYFGTDGYPIVQIKDAFYKVTKENGTVDFSIVNDRYIIANSPDTYNNTYDMEEEIAFCRNDSYNSRVLWLIDEDDLLSDDDLRTTFYVATGVNVNGLTDGGVLQGTIFPSFPVWGLNTPSFQLLDYWNDASRVSVQVYKGTVDTPTVAEYAFSLGLSLDYKGYVYPDSTNTIYSVSEIDTYSDTFSGIQVIHNKAFSAISALNNKQNMTFSYYIGTMNELKDAFVLRGTMYGVTDSGYIVAMTITDGVISNTQIVTKKGTMEFIGITQTYALFYSPYEKRLYSFDSTYVMTDFKEFSIGEIVAYSCRAEDNKIAVLTNEALYIVSGSSIMRIEAEANTCKFCKGWLLVGTRAYSSYDGEYKLDVEYDSGKQGSTYDTSVQLDEAIVMLDDSNLSVPPYLEYRIDVGDSIGSVEEMVPDCNNIIRIKPTTTRNEGLYYRIWLKTNCNLMGVSIFDNAEKKPNLTRNNG